MPDFKRMASKLAQTKMKKSAMCRFKDLFAAQMKSHGFEGNATLFFNHFLQKSLLTLSANDYPYFEELITKPWGINLFLHAHEAYETQPSLKVEKISGLPAKGIAALKTNPQAIDSAFQTFCRIKKLMRGRFTRHDEFTYLENTLKVISLPASPPHFDLIARFLNEIERIQHERPIVYHFNDQPGALLLFEELKTALREYPFLTDVFKEILDMTVILDRGYLVENIRALYQPTRWDLGKLNILTRRHAHPFALSHEIEPHLSLFEDSEEQIFFSATTQAYLTNEKTMETRSITLPLPFHGNMSKTSARKLLNLLEITINDPSQFDPLYDQLQLDPRAKETRKNLFLNWIMTLDQEAGKAIFDFNATQNREIMTYALENPLLQAAIGDPKNEAIALKAAQLKNIFQFKGRLSLLPPELAEEHPRVALLSDRELEDAYSLLTSNSKRGISISLAEKKEALLLLKKTVVKKGGVRAIKLFATFQIGKESRTRTTLYLINKRETPQDRLWALIKSGHFSRDLLLAKAESLKIV